MAKEEKEEKVGLDYLDDEALATIVEADLVENQDIKSPEASIAFKILAERSGEAM